jgi:hypothetical protein
VNLVEEQTNLQKEEKTMLFAEGEMTCNKRLNSNLDCSFISDGISFLSNKQTAIGRILRIVSSIIALYDYKQFSL